MKFIIADSKGWFKFKPNLNAPFKIKFIKKMIYPRKISENLVQVFYFLFIGIGKFLKIYIKNINVFYFIQLHYHMEEEVVLFKI